MEERKINVFVGLDDLVEAVKLIAKIQKAKYDALIEEGFTKDEALALVAKVPLFGI